MSKSAIDWTPASKPSESASMETVEDLDSVDLAEPLAKLRRGSGTIFVATLGVAAIATIVAFLLPVRYTSTVSFIPPNLNNSNTMASVLAGQLSALGGGELLGTVKSSGDLYAGILTSRSIADELIGQFHLMDVFRVKKRSQAEKILGSDTVVAVDQKSSIVSLG